MNQECEAKDFTNSDIQMDKKNSNAKTRNSILRWNHNNNYGSVQLHHFSNEDGITERGFRFKDNISSGTFSEISIEGINLFHSNHNAKKTRILDVEINRPVIQMFFLLKGECSAVNGTSKSSHNILGGQHNLIYRPYFRGKYLLESKNVQNFGIQLSEEYFTKLIDETSRFSGNLIENIYMKKENVLALNRNMHITPEMKFILFDIMNSKRKGFMKRLYLESKVTELFMLQIEQAEELSAGRLAFKLKNQDVEKLYAAKDFLEDNIFEKFSLFDISRAVGINDFKLKKGFKELFGKTVFSYLNELRMHQARRMLLDKKKNVFEIADILGYSEPHHFSAAFKRRFGYLPSKLKS